MATRLVLLPSPLLAGSFFEPLGAALRDAGTHVSILNVVGDSNAEMAWSAAHQAHRAAGDEHVVLVAYSGAGPLAPAVLTGFAPGQAAVAFLDATLPHPGRPRIEELREALPNEAFGVFEQLLRAGGRWPDWTDESLAPFVSDDKGRREVLAMVRARPLAFFEEALPAGDLPGGVACGYLRLSPAYDRAESVARSRGWPTRSLDLTHFAPYTHPREVARELAALVNDLLPVV